jgi:hypothetical protein
MCISGQVLEMAIFSLDFLLFSLLIYILQFQLIVFLVFLKIFNL